VKNPLKAPHRNGFTLIELCAVIATLAILAVVWLPALAGTKSDPRAFQCLNNQRQLILGWQMYAADNNDLLPPNDFPFATSYVLASPATKAQMNNWVVGTMEQVADAAGIGAIKSLTSSNTLLAPYVTNASVYHCPADNFISPFTGGKVHVRSYSMNSAVGTIFWSHFNGGFPLGSPVQGGWLPGTGYYGNQTTWLTYGKLSSFTRPGPANTFVIMDENPLSINDGALEISAVATPGNTYLIDYPSGLHGAAGVISFADGHVIIHKWLDQRTYNPQVSGPGGGGTAENHPYPDDPDCFYLAPITSAPR
jgi:prepilin-type N-terminal cleavage/methylation domain-containing protein